MTPVEVVAHLNARADSYWRDGCVFQDDGDAGMATAYHTIAVELCKLADEVAS